MDLIADRLSAGAGSVGPHPAVEHHGGNGGREAWIFARFARWTERQLGRSIAFALAFLTIIVWAATGPLFGWSDTWQLVINTATTIITFLMVFVIQNTQNRDTKAIHLKLDELIRVNRAARNSLMSLEEQSESEVEEIKSDFVGLAATENPPPRE
jgi:low affinity Fe/Cu permease